VGWLEYFSGSRRDQIDAVIAEIRARRTVKNTHWIVLFAVEAIERIDCRGTSLRVEHDPIECFQCHSLVVPITDDDRDAKELFAMAKLSIEPVSNE
jgi:hypothetical protein